MESINRNRMRIDDIRKTREYFDAKKILIDRVEMFYKSDIAKDIDRNDPYGHKATIWAVYTQIKDHAFSGCENLYLKQAYLDLIDEVTP